MQYYRSSGLLFLLHLSQMQYFRNSGHGPVAGFSRQENGTSVILRDAARARENIQKSLAGSSGPGASSGPSGDHSELAVRIASLEVENQSLRGGESLSIMGGMPALPCLLVPHS